MIKKTSSNQPCGKDSEYITGAFLKSFSIFFLFYSPTLNIICFVEKMYIFLRSCLSIFESDTVKIDCPIHIFSKMIKYLKI